MSYDRFPETKIIGYDHEVFNDEQAIYQELLKYKDLHCLVVDCYPGVDNEIYLYWLIIDLLLLIYCNQQNLP